MCCVGTYCKFQCPFRTNVNRTFCPFPPKLMEHLEKLIRLCLMSDALRHYCSTEIKAVNCCEEQLLHLGTCNTSIAQCNTPCSFACNSWVQYSATPLFVELQCHAWWYWTSCTVKKWSVSGRPPTDHIPTTYWPHTDHLPTAYRLHTDRIPTAYRPLTDHFFTVQLVQYYRHAKNCLQCNNTFTYEPCVVYIYFTNKHAVIQRMYSDFPFFFRTLKQELKITNWEETTPLDLFYFWQSVVVDNLQASVTAVYFTIEPTVFSESWVAT